MSEYLRTHRHLAREFGGEDVFEQLQEMEAEDREAQTAALEGAIAEHLRLRAEQDTKPDRLLGFGDEIEDDRWQYLRPHGVLPVKQPEGPPSVLNPDLGGGFKRQFRGQAFGIPEHGPLAVRRIAAYLSEPRPAPIEFVPAKLPKDLDEVQRWSEGDPLFPDQHWLRDDWVVKRCLDGAFPLWFRRVDGDPGALAAEFRWDECDFSLITPANRHERAQPHALPPHARYELPNVRAEFRRTGDELTLEAIEVQFRRPERLKGLPPEDAPPAGPRRLPADAFERTTRVVHPGDEPTLRGLNRWTWAKLWFRVSHLLATELDYHLGRSHLLIEQISVAIRRNLRDSPIRELLMPHLVDVDRINHLGSDIILGPGGVLARCSALDPACLPRRFRRSLQTTDWKGWSPREPLVPANGSARAAKLFFEAAVTPWVDAFFEQHRTEIERHWAEIASMSDELTFHSPPFRAYQDLPPERWVDANELGGARPDAHGPSMSRVSDLDDLRALCRFAIHHATWVHTWSHDEQWEDGRRLAWGCFGVRDRTVPTAETDLRDWFRRHGPTPIHGLFQLHLGESLVKTRWGYLTAEHESDNATPEGFRDLVDALRADFKALRDECDVKADVDLIRNRINT